MTSSRFLVRWGGLLALAIALAVLIGTGAWRQLSPHALQRHHAALFASVSAHPATSLAAFFLVCAAVSATSLPGPGLLALIGGSLFGWLAGGGTAAAGFTLGAAPTFLAMRAAAGGGQEMRSGRLGAMAERLKKNAFSTLLAIRLTPVAPIGLVTIAAGLARAPLGAFLAATVLGCAPAAMVYAALGQGLRGAVERGGLISPQQFADPRVLLPLAILAVVAAGAAAYRLRRS